MHFFEKMRITISKNDQIFKHAGSWTNVYIDYCQSNNLDFEVINGYEYDVIEKLKNFDVLLWHPQNYVLADMMQARSILHSASRMGLKIFPDFNTSWHFDDKIAEMYLLQSVNAPIPGSWVFYLLEDCLKWLRSEAKYPLVAKLKSGSGSNNVKLIRNLAEGEKYARKMFRNGYKPSPSVIFKASSKFKSSKDWNTILQRIKQIPDFLTTLSNARMFPREKGYVYFQEFIPNSGYDLKVVVVGDKVSGFARNTRKGDFRASGGGDLVYDNEMVTKNIRDIAFRVSDELKFQCMGFDFVVDSNSGKEHIIEMSYGFSHEALLDVKGYWDRSGNWLEEPMNAPEEVIKNILKSIK